MGPGSCDGGTHMSSHAVARGVAGAGAGAADRRARDDREEDVKDDRSRLEQRKGRRCLVPREGDDEGQCRERSLCCWTALGSGSS